MASTANKMQVRSVRSVPFVPTKRDPSAHGPASNAEKWNTPGNFFMAVNFAAFMTEVERLRAIDNIDCTRVSVGEEGSDDYVSVEWRFALMVPGTSVAFFVTKSRYAVRYIAPLSRAAVARRRPHGDPRRRAAWLGGSRRPHDGDDHGEHAPGARGGAPSGRRGRRGAARRLTR